MTLRFSQGLRNFLNEDGSMKRAFAGGRLAIYSGSQPATADAAASGTLLALITAASGAWTAEVPSAGTVTLDSGGSGSVDGITVNSIEIMSGVVAFNASLTQTAIDVRDNINNNPKNALFVASASGAVVTITARPGLGTLPNGWAVVCASTTIATTDVNMGTAVAGVNYANGLLFGDSDEGVLSKLTAQVWSGLGLSDGAAGWFRLYGTVADAGAADSAQVYKRIDGAVATTGGQLNSTNTNIVTGAVQTVGQFNLTLPAQQ